MGRMNPQDIEDTLRFLGGREGLREDFAQHKRNIEWLEGRREHLIQEHPNEWVVVVARGEGGPECRFAKDFPDVTKILDDVGVLRRTSVIQYLDPNPPALILQALSQ